MPARITRSQNDLWKQLLQAVYRRGFAATRPGTGMDARHHVYTPEPEEDYVRTETGSPWWDDPDAEQLPVLFRIVHPFGAGDAAAAARPGVIQLLDVHNFNESEVATLKLGAAARAGGYNGRTCLAMVRTPGGVLTEEAEATLLSEMLGELERLAT